MSDPVDPLRGTAQAWLAAARTAVVVQVLDARGSVPRGDGTRMLVAANAVAGTVGGGHLELKAIDTARGLLASARGAPAEPINRYYPLGPALGQCCGGALTLRYRPLDAAALADWPAPAPRFTLQLYGAGHVGRAVARLLAGIACRVQWIDEREAEFPPEADAPHIERVCVDAVEAEVAQAAPGSAYLVMTHSHDLDLRIVDAVLRRGDAAFLGLIGSATKRARFEHRLAGRGHAADVLANLTCPVGLPGITGKEPEVIAVSVVAQLLGLPQRP